MIHHVMIHPGEPKKPPKKPPPPVVETVLFNFLQVNNLPYGLITLELSFLNHMQKSLKR